MSKGIVMRKREVDIVLLFLFSLVFVAGIFADDMMEFNIKWKVSNGTVASIEIVPYSDDVSFIVDAEGKKTHNLDLDENHGADVCCIHYKTNRTGSNTLGLYATSLYCADAGSFGYTLYVAGEDKDFGHPLAQMNVTGDSPQAYESSNVVFDVSGLGVVNVYLYVYAYLSELESMPYGTYSATIKVEVQGT